MTNSESKTCRHCLQDKPRSQYHNNKEMRDGKSSYCKTCASKRSALWKKNNRDRAKNTELSNKYGITLSEYRFLLDQQNGRCAICGLSEQDIPRQTLFVDHCHTTGRVRGLLCHHCNSGLGHFMDSVDLLQKARAYLKPKQLEEL